ncbi:MAG: DUF2264 domain-containing protein [Burkholderiaceae bacterium]
MVLVLLVILVAMGVIALRKVQGVPGWSDRTALVEPASVTHGQLLNELSAKGPVVPTSAYEHLFQYLLEGFVNYRSPLGARAFLPGAPSDNGHQIDGVEGFSRFAPLASAWLASGRADSVVVGQRGVRVSELLTQGLLAGTDTVGPEYWGRLKDYDQVAYESGDIALALWLSRDQVWARLTPAQQTQIANWLRQALEVKMYAGNWSLPPLVVYASLRALGVDVSGYDERAITMFERFRSLYRGEGWFDDPPNGFDYYNSWAIHYNLFWLNQMHPDLYPAFIRKAQGEFGAFFKHFFGPHGHPMYGRSVCYRLGAATGLLTAAALDPQSVTIGEAMRALDTSTRFFGMRGAFAGGTVTQGFCGPDLSVVDGYSGQGSCQTGLRALATAFYLDGTQHVFAAPRQPLPVEIGNFKLHNATTNWTIAGNSQDGHVTLTIDTNPPDADLPLKRYTLSRQLMEMALNRSRRPDNHAALYESRKYSTATPGVACPAPAAP